MFPLLLLAACADHKVELPDTGEIPDLGDPFVGIYAATTPGNLRSDCVIQIDLLDGDEAVATASMLAGGGEWTGTALPGEVQYKAIASWESCTTGSGGYGTFESSAFSGVKGDFFLFRYNGVSAAFDSLVQREDFEGGVAEITYVEGTDEADVQAAAATIGVTATRTEGDTYEVTWDSPMAVGKVLSDFSKERYYLGGAPVWIRTPDWW